MVIDNAWELYEQELNKNRCISCHRKLANEKMRTKKGCIWCDSKSNLKGDKNARKK